MYPRFRFKIILQKIFLVQKKVMRNRKRKKKRIQVLRKWLFRNLKKAELLGLLIQCQRWKKKRRKEGKLKNNIKNKLKKKEPQKIKPQ